MRGTVSTGTPSIVDRSVIVISRSLAIWFIISSLQVGEIALRELCGGLVWLSTP
jgi:hypothetical protein